MEKKIAKEESAKGVGGWVGVGGGSEVAAPIVRKRYFNDSAQWKNSRSGDTSFDEVEEFFHVAHEAMSLQMGANARSHRAHLYVQGQR